MSGSSPLGRQINQAAFWSAATALGPLPRRAEFKQELEDLVTPEDLAVFFQVSFLGRTAKKELKKKAKMPAEELTERLDRLVTDAFLLAYESPEGPTYERLDVVFFAEHQIRKPGDTAGRSFPIV